MAQKDQNSHQAVMEQFQKLIGLYPLTKDEYENQRVKEEIGRLDKLVSYNEELQFCACQKGSQQQNVDLEFCKAYKRLEAENKILSVPFTVSRYNDNEPGLEATQDIRPEDVIMHVTGIVCKAVRVYVKETPKPHCFPFPSLPYFINTSTRGSFAKFIRISKPPNSLKPNTQLRLLICTGSVRLVLTATKKIRKGEELILDSQSMEQVWESPDSSEETDSDIDYMPSRPPTPSSPSRSRLPSPSTETPSSPSQTASFLPSNCSDAESVGCSWNDVEETLSSSSDADTIQEPSEDLNKQQHCSSQDQEQQIVTEEGRLDQIDIEETTTRLSLEHQPETTEKQATPFPLDQILQNGTIEQPIPAHKTLDCAVSTDPKQPSLVDPENEVVKNNSTQSVRNESQQSNNSPSELEPQQKRQKLERSPPSRRGPKRHTTASSDQDFVMEKYVCYKGCCKHLKIPYNTSRQSDLDRHQKNSPELKCPHCKYTTHIPSNLNAHVERHFKRTVYKCSNPKCNKEFFERKSFVNHIRGKKCRDYQKQGTLQGRELDEWCVSHSYDNPEPRQSLRKQDKKE